MCRAVRFGDAPFYPYQYGCVEVVAPTRHKAVKCYSEKYPEKEGLVNCAFIYGEEEFKNAAKHTSLSFSFIHETLVYSFPGICPNCGTENYGNKIMSVDKNGFHYIWKCENCGCKVNEIYDLVFKGQEVPQNDNQKRV